MKKFWKKIKQPTADTDLSAHFPWRRFTLSLIGIFFIFLMWRWSTNHLYSLPEYALPTFSSITTNSMYALSALVIWFVTGQLIYNWQNSTSTVIQEAHNIATTVSRTVAPKHFDDPAIP